MALLKPQISYKNIYLCGTESGAMTQVVRRRHLIALARVRFQTTPCEICGEQGGTGEEFSPMISHFPSQCHSASTPQSFIVVKQHA